ncbi:MAG: hypothetical protein CL779_03125 [Chloroflexi bacterium]|nr:hypothetical protein [Chloroflexota bacterium]|tara:strand:+ start:127 stop:357 length:231 start_codon:yes stop_codon:yes gene_type:complete
MNKSLSNEMYQSLILKYEKEIQECKTGLLIYFNNSVGIGDHPNHLEEMDRLLINMSSSNDKLNILKSTFSKLYSRL